MIITRDFTFEASHILPLHPGKCSRLHGHSWKLRVGIWGHVNPETGFIMDYGDLKELVNKHIIDVLDHQHLGCGSVTLDTNADFPTFDQMPPFGMNFYPSSENLVKAITRILEVHVAELPRQPRLPQLKLALVKLDETCTSSAIWYNPHVWKLEDSLEQTNS